MRRPVEPFRNVIRLTRMSIPRRHPAPPSPRSQSGSLPLALPALSVRGAIVLLALALLAGLSVMVPVRGEVLGLASGIAGVLAVALIVPEPERRPLLALGWGALAFALPVSLVLARPGLPLGLGLACGAAGLWTLLCLTADRTLPRL
ncbi:hypothetical protein [Pararhodobacter aggregans]|uniref:hypothetical protein n=1 Tax=Pararhodobacter aggregans TaxID=404875 RepID=UPI003A95D735